MWARSRALASHPASGFPDLFSFVSRGGDGGALASPGAGLCSAEAGQPSPSPTGRASLGFQGTQGSGGGGGGGGRQRPAFALPKRPPRRLCISVKTRLYSRRSMNPPRRARNLRLPPARATSPPRRPPSCLPPQTTRPPAPCRPPPPRSTTQPATARSLPILTNGTFKSETKRRTKPCLRD